MEGEGIIIYLSFVIEFNYDQIKVQENNHMGLMGIPVEHRLAAYIWQELLLFFKLNRDAQVVGAI